MKIAITGHTAGIGKSFSQSLAARGHEIVGISRSEGENIRRIEHTASLIEPCDLFINNAQSMFAQTELLYGVWRRWRGQKKYIWNISTEMAKLPVNTCPDTRTDGLARDDLTMSLYRVQKVALEEASRQLSWKSKFPKISIIRPGGVATQEANSKENKHDPDQWVKCVIDIFTSNKNLHIPEISITHSYTNIDL
jgi:nucleoside-diphosphate-sugar epimerase